MTNIRRTNILLTIILTARLIFLRYDLYSYGTTTIRTVRLQFARYDLCTNGTTNICGCCTCRNEIGLPVHQYRMPPQHAGPIPRNMPCPPATCPAPPEYDRPPPPSQHALPPLQHAVYKPACACSPTKLHVTEGKAEVISIGRRCSSCISYNNKHCTRHYYVHAAIANCPHKKRTSAIKHYLTS